MKFLGVWSLLKSHIKTYIRQNCVVMLHGDPTGQLSKQEWRMQFLEQAAAISKVNISQGSCVNTIEHVSHVYANVKIYSKRTQAFMFPSLIKEWTVDVSALTHNRYALQLYHEHNYLR
jgi:hypothetical protein